MSTDHFQAIITQDGHTIARDRRTGLTASGRTLEEALAELRRLLEQREREEAA